MDIRGTCLKFYLDFQEWVFSNNIMVAASGFAIGMATKEIIENLLNTLVRPALVFLFQIELFKDLYQRAIWYVPESNLDAFLTTLAKVSWSVFEWGIIIVMTFLLLEYFLNRNIIGLKSTVKEGDKTDFVKSKVEAHERILPTQADIHKYQKKEQLEKQAGRKIVQLDEKKLETTANINTTTNTGGLTSAATGPFTGHLTVQQTAPQVPVMAVPAFKEPFREVPGIGEDDSPFYLI